MTLLTNSRLAWHFVRADYKLRDGKPSILGAVETFAGPMVLCQSGLHWSEQALDALQYATSPIIRRVRVWGDVQTRKDKGISRNREVLWHGDVDSVLRAFARKQALSVIHLWDAPSCVRGYLETGDETLRDAAFGAAFGAVMDGARAAFAAINASVIAGVTAWTAPRDAARDAALAAAKAAGMASLDRVTAWTAPRDAAMDAALAAAGDAACDAAWPATRDAARDAALGTAKAAITASLDRVTAWTAPRDATRDAACDAALVTAWTAARDAARDAARVAWYDTRAAAWTAARAAARGAARSAEWAAARAMLDEMLITHIGAVE